MSQYLYGAAVHGIQSFILETNKLREIAGGSEFVNQICKTRFQEVLGSAYRKDNLIQGAAGIIRYLFEADEIDSCKRVVRDFPFQILKEAPGIDITQAVIEIEGELATSHISELIRKLDAQRNNPPLSFLPAPMIAERSRNNGQGAVTKEKEDFLSRQQKLKRGLADKLKIRRATQDSKEEETLADKIGLSPQQLPLQDLDEISGKGDNKDQWLAVVHADGNSIGKLIMKANTLLQQGGNVKAFYQQFSKALDKTTTEAARAAAQAVLKSEIQSWDANNPEKNKVPIRPVLLGGDDLTVIIKAKYALDFTAQFIQAFECQSKKLVYEEVLKGYGDFTAFENGLTTCAGIAYIKPHYPFHYAENLAEQLCKAAKKEAKSINEDCAPSCLMFHQVHSSFTGKWEETVDRELTVIRGSFAAGPYFLNKQDYYKTIKEIQEWSAALNKTENNGERTSLKAQLRALITEDIDNPAGASQYEARLRQINKSKQFEEIGFPGTSIFYASGKDKGTGKEPLVSHAWDIIKLATIQL